MLKSSNSIRRVLPPVFLLICFWWTSIYGLNFGGHWDEHRAKFDSVRDTLRTGIFLQASDFSEWGTNYNHGGLNYLLTWSGFTPEIVKFLVTGPWDREALSRAITPVLYSTSASVRVRGIFLLLSSLSIVWLYCLNLLLGRSRFESFLAAAILAASWEVAYHSRWVAPDAIMMQFSLLSFLCLAMGVQSKREHWFYLGAVSAGLTTGAKYTGGIVIPFLVAGVAWSLWRERRSVLYVVRRCGVLVATAVGTFVVTTPGVVIDPFRFLEGLREQQQIYSTGWYGYTVQPGWRHLVEMVRYVSLQVFSHYWSLSIVLALFCALGIVALMRERRFVPCLLLACVLVYVAYFSQQSAMIVRNLLVVVPCLALAAARGIVIVGERLGRGKALLYVAVGIFLGINLGWQIYAARQVKVRFHPEYYANAFVQNAERSPTQPILISAKLSKFLHDAHASLPANLISDPALPHTRVAFLQTESADVLWEKWPSNRWGMYEKVFGPLEVNLEAYSTFLGNERILLVTRESFQNLPIKEADLMR